MAGVRKVNSGVDVARAKYEKWIESCLRFDVEADCLVDHVAVGADGTGDQAWRNGLLSARIDIELGHGNPVVLYRTDSPAGGTLLWLAKRHGNDWERQVVFQREPLRLTFSNLASSSTGTVSFVAVNEADGQVWFVTIDGKSVAVESVWQDSVKPADLAGLQLGTALRFTPGGTPIILLSRDDSKAGYIRTLRPRVRSN